MLSRQRPVHRRLIRAYAIFTGLLLLLTWAGSLAYFFWSERVGRLQAVQTQAAIVATQSSAAVVFEDYGALAENLSGFSHMHGLNWVVVLASSEATTHEPRRLAQHGRVPEHLQPWRERLGAEGKSLLESTQLTVRENILHNGIARAELLVNIDLHEQVREFLVMMWLSLVINVLFLVGAIIVFERIVRTVSQPIGELVTLAEQVAASGALAGRAETRYSDEVGQLGRAFNRMLDTVASRERELSHSQDELRALNARLRDIREQERTRISHEIHDELGQRMTAIKFELARLTDAEARQHISQMVDETIKVVRTISWELRPSLLDSLGLAAAIEWLGKDFQKRVGIRCGIAVPDLADLPPEQATDLFRICQELLTNITRHAKASRADIHLEIDAETIILEVSDDGVGIPQGHPRKRSLGLLGMRERSQRWGGTVDIGPGAHGRGTRVRVTLPRVANNHSPLEENAV